MEMEDIAAANSQRYPLIPAAFEFSEGDHKSSLGFMELLSVQDYSLAPNFALDSIKENSEIWNHWPTTPNSSSLSSTTTTSSEALNDEQTEENKDDREEPHQVQEPKKTDKQLKAKKTNQKKQKEPRFAFMTKSEVDHLEDGYRWRKYGQKAVKNSPHPRSYYRCTSVACNVKKRVERCLNDPGIVVTTYEGQHTHPSPIMPRSTFLAPPSSTAIYGGSAMTASGMSMPTTTPSLFYYQNALNYDSQLSSFHRRPAAAHFLAADHGLLQDAIPSNMLRWADAE